MPALSYHPDCKGSMVFMFYLKIKYIIMFFFKYNNMHQILDI